MTAIIAARTQKIRQINDDFRRTLTGGRTVITQGVACRPDLPKIIERVRNFDAFDSGNNPHQENEFGAFIIGEQQFFFKIDYYSLDMDKGSEDPADENITRRILTILLAEEY